MTPRIAALCSAAVLAALFLICSGCRMAAMPLDPALAQGGVKMEVQGQPQWFWKDSFSFGPYRVSGKDTSWVTTTSWGWLGYSHSDAEQDLAFEISGPAGQGWRCRCTTRASQKMLKGILGGEVQVSWELEGNVLYVCSFLPPEQGKRWDLALARDEAQLVLNGYLVGPGGEVRVEGTRQLEGTSIPLSEATGYRFTGDRGALGAVQLINDQVAWLARDMDKQTAQAVAAAAAALMIYKDITPDR